MEKIKVLFDIGHPAHVHLFSNVAKQLVQKGHDIFFTCREKEFEKELLEYYQFPYISFGKKRKSRLGKLITLVVFELKMYRVAKRWKADVFVSHGSPYSAHVSFLMGKPHISLEDTGNMEQVRIYLPFTEVVLTPSLFHMDLGPKQITYKGCHELAYLSEKYFKPNPKILEKLGVSENDKYVLLRFVAWRATHDLHHYGCNSQQKLDLVNNLERLGYRVFISSESELEPELMRYKMNLHPHEILDVINYASVFIGEGATMAMEAAILGVPSIFVSTIQLGYISELCGFHIIEQVTGDKINERLESLISAFGNREHLLQKRADFLKNKIEVSDYLTDFIINYSKVKKGNI